MENKDLTTCLLESSSSNLLFLKIPWDWQYVVPMEMDFSLIFL